LLARSIECGVGRSEKLYGIGQAVDGERRQRFDGIDTREVVRFCERRDVASQTLNHLQPHEHSAAFAPAERCARSSCTNALSPCTRWNKPSEPAWVAFVVAAIVTSKGLPSAQP
jgi:hypothetical protein